MIDVGYWHKHMYIIGGPKWADIDSTEWMNQISNSDETSVTHTKPTTVADIII